MTAEKGDADLGILRFLTCGSVDDGKSSLIGRLLFDAGHVLADELEKLQAESAARGGAGGAIDYSLLLDGLQAEREQGITIDVAYRYFSTQRRKFIVADTPGHEQYTRNMATGATVADLAVVLIDARKGVLKQTRRHSAILNLFGLQRIVVAVNKMDLVGYSEDVFAAIRDEYQGFATKLGLAEVSYIPVVARDGDNVAERSTRMPWYQGPTLLSFLESFEPRSNAQVWDGFAMPVQWVNRPHLDYRGLSGTVVSGAAKPGDPVVILPSARTTTIRALHTADGDLSEATLGDAVTLVLDDAVDASRGDIIAAAGRRPELTDQLAAHVICLSDEALLPGRAYWLRSRR
jgi:bifunctional enzyme CysN/CysC